MTFLDKIIIAAHPFSPEDKIAKFRESQNNAGAIISFTGIVRDHVMNTKETDDVTALHLQHFSGFTEKQIAKFVQMAWERFEVKDLLIVHRVGTLLPTEPIVLVAVAAEHRRAAFEAADYLMDYLKTSAPFWKKEIRGTQSVWIEPRSDDYEDKARWDTNNET